MSLILSGCGGEKVLSLPFNTADITKSVKQNDTSNSFDTSLELMSKDLCVSSAKDDILSADVDMSLAEGAALFSVDDNRIEYSKNLYERLYPASTTKILTALVALENGNLDDTIQISANALELESGATVCGFEEGDTVTLLDALRGLLICSGNDAAIAIAEYIGGSVDGFCDMMNERASSLGAVNSHFINPNGLHDDNHYTTVYDLYLIFNAAIKDETFIDIVGNDSYTATVTSSDGTTKELTWETTNKYFNGNASYPQNTTVIGGKTGTTNEAGSCLVLLSQCGERKYISIILKSVDGWTIYGQMTQLISLEK